MAKILAVLLWPAGIAVIITAGALLARRAHRAIPGGPGGAGTRSTGALPPGGRHGSAATGRYWDKRLIAVNTARFCLIAVVGAAVIYGAMCALGTIVVHAGPAIDKPVFTWTLAHRVSAWAHVMKRLTKIGNVWTTWGACAAAAVCLAVAGRRDRWLPPVIFGAAIVVDHYLKLAIGHTFHRIGPPTSPHGSFPSGGVDRIILFYGLIAYLLWREFSGQRRAAIWAGTAVAALAFNEAYSRGYLTLHWFTDILSGLFYGTLLLLLFIVAIRFVVGPAEMQPAPEPVPLSGRAARTAIQEADAPA
jgi:membrane-associated phospholipid phosphatase